MPRAMQSARQTRPFLPTASRGSSYFLHPRVRTGSHSWSVVVFTGPEATFPPESVPTVEDDLFPRRRMAHQSKVEKWLPVTPCEKLQWALKMSSEAPSGCEANLLLP